MTVCSSRVGAYSGGGGFEVGGLFRGGEFEDLLYPSVLYIPVLTRRVFIIFLPVS